MPSLFYRLLTDESGQDMVEYALLTAFLGLAAVAAVNITNGLGTSYNGFTSSTNALWVTPDPATAAQ